MERDLWRFSSFCSLNISTHTLTWSVTRSNSVRYRINHISTHTLTWSVTVGVTQAVKDIFISTHTLTWSVTVSSFRPALSTFHFNSHAHVERDSCSFVIPLSSDISTHTLTWSVTPLCCHVERSVSISTHTLTWSVTKITDEELEMIEISTHTLTWSVTFVTSLSPLDLQYFNSHAHVERDMGRSLKNIRDYISTHTLTWSVTYLYLA